MLLKTKKIAYLGILLALNQIFIFLSSIISTNTIFLFCMAALIIAIVVVEYDKKSGFVFYVASCILGFLLTINKIEFISYMIFFGIYSVVKSILEIKIQNKFLVIICKYIFFNLVVGIGYFLVNYFVLFPFKIWMLVAVQIFFIVYDYALSLFINYYIDNILPKIKL